MGVSSDALGPKGGPGRTAITGHKKGRFSPAICSFKPTWNGGVPKNQDFSAVPYGAFSTCTHTRPTAGKPFGAVCSTLAR